MSTLAILQLNIVYIYGKIINKILFDAMLFDRVNFNKHLITT